jgi:hypothetical protein
MSSPPPKQEGDGGFREQPATVCSGDKQEAAAQEREPRPPVHAAFHRLEPIDLPRDLTETPGIVQRRLDDRRIPPDPRREVAHLGNRTPLRLGQPACEARVVARADAPRARGHARPGRRPPGRGLAGLARERGRAGRRCGRRRSGSSARSATPGRSPRPSGSSAAPISSARHQAPRRLERSTRTARSVGVQRGRLTLRRRMTSCGLASVPWTPGYRGGRSLQRSLRWRRRTGARSSACPPPERPPLRAPTRPHTPCAR